MLLTDPQWARIQETLKCVISCRKQMPGMKMEDAFSSDALKQIEEELEWVKTARVKDGKIDEITEES